MTSRLGFAITPFRALLWNDPDGPEDGVVQIDSVIHIEGTTNYGESQVSFQSVIKSQNPLGRLKELTDAKWLVRAPEPAMYLYSCGFTNPEGTAQQSRAILALYQGGKDSEMGQKTQAGLLNSLTPRYLPISAEGFETLLMPNGLPIARATTPNGQHHRIWPVTQRGVWDVVASAAIAALRTDPSLIDGDSTALLAIHPASEPFPTVTSGLVIPDPQPPI